MFGFGSKKRGSRRDIVGALHPEVSREALGVSEAFPGIAPNPLLSGEARRRNAELRSGEVAIGTLVAWHEIGGEGQPRVILSFDVQARGGVAFRGVADEVLSVTRVARLEAGQTHPLRFRPAVMDHYVALVEGMSEAELAALVADVRGS